jgi:hypothetical protein
MQSPPQSPSTRSSISSSASHDELLSLRMQRSDSQKSIPASHKATKHPSDEGAVDVRPMQDDDRLSFEDLFDPGRTAKENKSLLMSAELDQMGMGRCEELYLNELQQYSDCFSLRSMVCFLSMRSRLLHRLAIRSSIRADCCTSRE